jgi:glyoxylase-like metal-dependent hydrolase (beta-lactamase superfamily II)
LVQLIRTEAATAKITVQPLRGNVSALMGSGGNIAVFPGRDGKLLIDAAIPGSRSRITEALTNISSDPIKHLVNTHWHFDHTDGNEWVHAAGATIVAHENTLKHLLTATKVDDWDYTFPPSPASALPTEVFQTEWTLHMNGAAIALKRYLPTHTDSDISVYFAEADVFHVGDTWWNGVYPFIDYSTGGSIDGRSAVSSLPEQGRKNPHADPVMPCRSAASLCRTSCQYGAGAHVISFDCVHHVTQCMDVILNVVA